MAETEQKKIEPDIIEDGSKPTDPLGEIRRGWRIKVGNKPLVEAQAGQIARLTKGTAIEALYLGRIRLLELPEEGIYRCILPFRYLNPQGEYEGVKQKSKLMLTATEAHEQLRKNTVRPCFDTATFGRYIEE